MKFLSKKNPKDNLPPLKPTFFSDLYKSSLNEGDEVIENLTESNNRNINSNLVYSYKPFV